MRVGFMAREPRGETIHLPGAKHPRKALLAALGRKSAHKIYRNNILENGKFVTKHVGYIVAGRWFTLYEVHEWIGKI